jgi:hypothetical protein
MAVLMADAMVVALAGLLENQMVVEMVESLAVELVVSSETLTERHWVEWKAAQTE